MHAVVLVGGLGLRLRPLTESCPKPMLPFFDKPLLEWVIEPLLQAEATETITLATGFASRVFTHWARSLGARVRVRREPDPRGTGGALGWVLSRADQPRSSPLWVQNGDALLWPEPDRMLAAHRAHSAAGTLGVLWHPQPQRYGRIHVDSQGRVRAFAEKDAGSAEPGWINAGVYLLEQELWRQLGAGPSSLERDWFPRWLAEDRVLRAHPLETYFCDLGTPESFRQAHWDVLAGRTPVRLVGPPPWGPGAAAAPHSTGPVWLGKDVVCAAGSTVVGPAVLGSGCQLAKGAAVRDSILGPSVRVGASAQVEGCLLGRGFRVAPRRELREEVLSR